MILLLEDDPAIAATVVFALQREGFEVQHHLLLGEARQAAARRPPQAAVLDLGLPDGHGMDLCRAWRQGQDAALRVLPVLMLTARAEEMDRVLALETGADDYLTKPFSPRELIARLRALLRRASFAAPAPQAGGLFELDEAGQRVRYAGQPLPLTRLEYRLLAALLQAPGRILSREWLLDAAWGQQSEATDRTVDTHVKTLRAKLRDCRPDLEPITTHRGLGYALELPPPAAR
ncbi:two-component system response regulator CreB [Ideonella azotifigens]|uniref:Two-component system response regulator CreB n=1 Tax=Ideonella azotifigens TaxID=513160 RepID=A0ABN1JQQ2_9BURK|nr:two-component system response regulator CreB [Ideonella azotifigens]MCD2340213.1 two-component system response regulator CreB [Ideonella azotifigens]